MVDLHSKSIRLWRWIVFALAAFYAVYMIVMSPYLGNAGGPFRYLTIWALLLNFFAASRNLAFTEYRTERRYEGLIPAICVINAMVVLLYWRLYFADPTSVTRGGELGIWWQELYLHALGPALLWIDALLVNRAFRRPVASLAWLVGIIGAYVAWIELFVGPFNAQPIGSVTSGLPYPFLNDLTLDGRAVFYGTNIAVAVVLLALFFAVKWLQVSLANRALSPSR
ncbi:MAG: hypothetical protein ACU0DW_04050 [Shimia sp.]